MRLSNLALVAAIAVPACAGEVQTYKAATWRLLYEDANAIRNAVQDRPIVDVQNERVDRALMFATLERMARERGITAILVVDSSGHILGQSVRRSASYAYRIPSAESYASAKKHDIVIDADCKQPVATAFVWLDALQDAYMLVVRNVDLKQLCEPS